MNRIPSRIIGLSCAALWLLAIATSASAVQHTFFGLDDPRGTFHTALAAHNNFVAALDLYGTDDLESFPNGTPFPTLVFGATGITTTSSSGFVATFPPLAESGLNALVDIGPTTPNDPPVDDAWTFSQPVTAFGSYFAQSGTEPYANIITLKLENVGLGTSTIVDVATVGPGASFDNVFFFGVTDTNPFDRVTLIERNDSAPETIDFDGILLDDITVGIVPEPSSLALVTVGLIFAALVKFGKATRRAKKC